MTTAKVKTLVFAFAPMACCLLVLPFYRFASPGNINGLPAVIGTNFFLFLLFNFSIKYCNSLADKGLQLTALFALMSHMLPIAIFQLLPIALWGRFDYNSINIQRFGCFYMACLTVTGMTVLFSWRKYEIKGTYHH